MLLFFHPKIGEVVLFQDLILFFWYHTHFNRIALSQGTITMQYRNLIWFYSSKLDLGLLLMEVTVTSLTYLFANIKKNHWKWISFIFIVYYSWNQFQGISFEVSFLLVFPHFINYLIASLIPGSLILTQYMTYCLCNICCNNYSCSFVIIFLKWAIRGWTFFPEKKRMYLM